MKTEEQNENNYLEEEREQEQSAAGGPHKLSEYVVSWKWLIGGLLFFIAIGVCIGGIYYHRSLNFSQDILGVVKRMRDEADTSKKKADELTAAGGKKEDIAALLRDSYKKRHDAANLLKGYVDRPGQEANVKLLTILYELNESLLEDESSIPRLLHNRRVMIMDNCKRLIQAITAEDDAFPYQLRLLELEWEQRNFPGVLDRAKTVFQIDARNGRENYESWRYVTLAVLARLQQSIKYDQIGGQLNLPPTLDALLDKVLQMRPENVDIANRYAQYLAEVSRREELRQCSSQAILDMPEKERLVKAMAIINDMVSRNPQEVRAYLVRYGFKKLYLNPVDDPVQLDPDIEAILKIAPSNPEGLILAGSISFAQSAIAARNGNKELSESKKKLAEKYLKDCIEKNPSVTAGYLQLGQIYAADGRIDDAIKIWEEGVQKNLPIVNPELVGRLIIALIEQKKFEKAEENINHLHKYAQEMQISTSQEFVRQIQNLAMLLTARQSAAEAAEATAKAEAARAAGQTTESQKFYSIAQRKTSETTQLLEKRLNNFGKTPYDFIVDENSIYYHLLGDSLILAGRLMAEQSKWSKAADFFGLAMRFDKYRKNAALLASNAYQQLHLPEQAVAILGDVLKYSPNDITLRYQYVQSLYLEQIPRRLPSLVDLDNVEKELAYLAEYAGEIPNPWLVDIRIIHIQLAKENLSNDPERMFKASQDAARKFNALESKEFPLREGDNPDEKRKVYSDDLAFLSELAGIYSSMARISDFDRILQKMRELPDGEPAYFNELINDALRRNDRDSAVAAAEEAMASAVLTPEQKQRFILLMKDLKDDTVDSMDKVYSQLKSTFDQSPDMLKPQAFFLLANIAIDRNDLQQAKAAQERLEQMEGAPDFGTMWRYIKARYVLAQQEPDYDSARKILEEIIALDSNWDMAYLLRARIEEQFIKGKPEDPKARDKIIEAYQTAIRCGNIQPAVWNRLLVLCEEAGRLDDIKKLRREAMIRNVRLEGVGVGRFPQPYQRMYDQVSESLESDPQSADQIARQCIVLAEGRREKPDLIFSLQIAFGKLFLDADLIDSAMRHLREVSKRGGAYVYPLAVALAKAKKVDEGFNLILDEIDRMPSSMPTLIPSILVLFSEVTPSEAVFQRIDKLMLRIENGERPVLSTDIEKTDEKTHHIDFDKPRSVNSMLLRFPENSEIPNPDSIEIFPPEDDETEIE
ncbi:MAG: hypothetical protein FWE67_06450 [Planctomycetaceae bacterium]|nr:hypothetical protein [Planctomycetaceae bacterium]